MKFKAKIIMTYFWNSPGFGVRFKTKNRNYAFVIPIPYQIALILAKIKWLT